MARGKAKTGTEAAERIRRELALHPPRRIFVPGREHIGDAVNLTGPLLGLRQLFPDAHIVVEVGERCAPIIKALPGLDEVWLRPQHQGFFGKASHIRRLQTNQFDLAVLLDDSNDLVLQAKLGGIPRRVGIWRGKKYQDLFDAYVSLTPQMHEVRDHGQAVIQMLGLDEPCDQPQLFPTEEERRSAEELWSGLNLTRPTTALHLGASVPERRLPDEMARRLVAGILDMGVTPVVLAGTSAEEEMARGCGLPSGAVILQPSLSLLAFAVLLQKFDEMVCTDSGPMHLRAAMGGRVSALFWTSNPSHTGPWGEGHDIFRSASGDPQGISVAEVLTALQNRLRIRPS